MDLTSEPLGQENLTEVFQFVRTSNPFAQQTWGWDAGRFVDWRWGSGPLFESAAPGWMSRHCTIYRDGAEMVAVSIAEYGDAAECVLTATEAPDIVGTVMHALLADHKSREIPLTFDFSDQAEWLRSLCRDAGMIEKTGTGHEWEYDLATVAGSAPLADGFTLGTMADVAAPSVAAVAECIRRAFHTNHEHEVSLRSLEESPMYRPELSIVVQAPNGSVAAYCRGTVDTTSGVCGIDPVCTQPDYQRLGLSRAAVQACFAKQRDLGGRFSYIGSAAEPAPGTFLYRALGPRSRTNLCRWTLG